MIFLRNWCFWRFFFNNFLLHIYKACDSQQIVLYKMYLEILGRITVAYAIVNLFLIPKSLFPKNSCRLGIVTVCPIILFPLMYCLIYYLPVSISFYGRYNTGWYGFPYSWKYPFHWVMACYVVGYVLLLWWPSIFLIIHKNCCHW